MAVDFRAVIAPQFFVLNSLMWTLQKIWLKTQISAYSTKLSRGANKKFVYRK